jgi:predicted nucleotidyltransferase
MGENLRKSMVGKFKYPKGINIYHMVQKCNFLKVLEVFFIEPTTPHYIKGISKQIKLAPTSVRTYVKKLLKEGLIKKRLTKPFSGFVANRENEDFIFYKRVYNLYSLKELVNFIVSQLYPKLIVVYGSYSFGEDVEESDVDILVLAKSKKEINLEKFEKMLKRRIHLIRIEDFNKLESAMKKKIWNGIVLYGGF